MLHAADLAEQVAPTTTKTQRTLVARGRSSHAIFYRRSLTSPTNKQLHERMLLLLQISIPTSLLSSKNKKVDDAAEGVWYITYFS